MRYAIISDVHSNLEAIEVVMGDIDRAGVDAVFCLGDIVGYGANPNEVASIVRARSSAIVAGNHDYAAVGLTETDSFNSYARAAAEWTVTVLSPATQDFLRGLPLTSVVDDLRLVHATPRRPAEWRYVFQPEEAARELAAVQETICFIGHSHLPGVFERNAGRSRLREFGPLPLDGPGRYLINVGSVGQPRDGNASAAYAVYDAGRREVELRRVPYDIATAQAKIRRAGLPDILAERLERGE